MSDVIRLNLVRDGRSRNRPVSVMAILAPDGAGGPDAVDRELKAMDAAIDAGAFRPLVFGDRHDT